MSQMELLEEWGGREESVRLSDLPRPEDIVGPAPTPALIDSIAVGWEGSVRLSRLANGRLVVRDGGRRIKALWRLREKEVAPFVGEDFAITAFVRDWTGPEDLLARVAANATARPNPVQQFISLRELANYMPVKDIAAETGMLTAQVRAVLKLMQLTPELQQAFIDGGISATAARALAALPHTQQEVAERQLAADGRLLVADVAKLRQTKVADSMAEFLAQADLLEAPQHWPCVVDPTGGTVTIAGPDGSTWTVDRDSFMEFLRSAGEG